MGPRTEVKHHHDGRGSCRTGSGTGGAGRRRVTVLRAWLAGLVFRLLGQAAAGEYYHVTLVISPPKGYLGSLPLYNEGVGSSPHRSHKGQGPQELLRRGFRSYSGYRGVYRGSVVLPGGFWRNNGLLGETSLAVVPVRTLTRERDGNRPRSSACQLFEARRQLPQGYQGSQPTWASRTAYFSHTMMISIDQRVHGGQHAGMAETGFRTQPPASGIAPPCPTGICPPRAPQRPG